METEQTNALQVQIDQAQAEGDHVKANKFYRAQQTVWAERAGMDAGKPEDLVRGQIREFADAIDELAAVFSGKRHD